MGGRSLPDTDSLAVVIPAFKGEFLERALASLTEQTDLNFRIYVGDDASPDDLESIIKRWSSKLRLHYTRFPENLGQYNLVRQWTRCIEMCDEPWVWLFSDDDEADPGCVESWRAAQRLRPKADLFHFDVVQIDGASRVQQVFPEFPELLTITRFLEARFERKIASFAPEYIFRRAAWNRVGGFEIFPLAWCSDDATWIKIAARSGIHSVSGPKVRWRLSGSNITTSSNRHARLKAQAATAYLNWVRRQLDQGAFGTRPEESLELKRLSVLWLHGHIQSQATGVHRVLASWDSIVSASGWRGQWAGALFRHLYWEFHKSHKRFATKHKLD
jgi:glycosyltransferase involved in cell wall biosynthesis